MLTDYVQGNSLMHRLHPLTKFLWSITVVCLSLLSTNPIILLVVFASNIIVTISSGLLRKMIPVFKGLIIFSLILVLCQVFLVEDGEPYYLLPFAQLGRVTDLGLQLSLIMALRMINTVSTIPLLLMTTRMTDLSYMLTGTLRLPYSYVFMFLTALQFIPAYISEMNRILKAQMARGYESDTKNIFKKLAVIIPLAVPLLVMAVRKIQVRAISMDLRGFGNSNRTSYRSIQLKMPDYISGILMLVTIGCTTLTVYR